MYTNVNDYIPRLKEMFPDLCESDIKRMVEYGWRMFYLYNLKGCDTLIESSKYKYWMYCGEMTKDSVKYFNYYRKKLLKKLRVLFIKKKIKWDGYYYTGVTEEELNELKKSFKGPGRKKKHFNFNNKICFKIADEAKLYHGTNSKGVIKFKYVTDMGYVFKVEKLNCTDVEIVLEKNHPDKFVDILINNNKYELL